MSEVYVDDVDVSVVYSGDWQSSTDMRSYQNSVHFTTSVNAEAKLTFTGINVMAYGVVRASETPQSSYSLDGGDPTILLSIPRVITQYGVLLYTSPALRNAQHNLVIKNLGNGSTFFIDYFVITGAASFSSATSTIINTPISSIRPGTTSSVSSSTTGIISTPGSGSSSSTFPASLRGTEYVSSSDVPPASTALGGNTGTSSPGATAKNSHFTAAIIGSVAALAIVSCFIVLWVWLRRRRMKKKEFESWIINSFLNSAGASSSTTSFAAPRVNEERLPFPPRYATSEPPAYDVNVAPMVQVQVQVHDTQPFGRSVGLEKGSMTTTQSSDLRVTHDSSPTSRNNEIN